MKIEHKQYKNILPCCTVFEGYTKNYWTQNLNKFYLLLVTILLGVH